MGKKPQDKVSCRMYFTHAFNSCVMGYMDLGLKILETVLYGVCLIMMGFMKVFPWRKKILADKGKDKELN
jgi:hypothetical protein